MTGAVSTTPCWAAAACHGRYRKREGRRAHALRRRQLRPLAYAESIDEARPVLRGEPFTTAGGADSALFADVKAKVKALQDAGRIDEVRAGAFREHAASTMVEQMAPAYQRLIVWLDAERATAYKIGMMKIQELRAEAERELGEPFDIRDFHDVVLGSGGVPLPVLETLVRDWVAQVKAG